MKQKSIAVFLMILLLISMFSGCMQTPPDNEQTQEPIGIEDKPITNEPDTDSPKEEDEPVEEDEPQEPEFPTLDNVVEMRDFMYENVNQGILEFSFDYTGNTNRVNSETMAEILAALHVSVEKVPEHRIRYLAKVTLFPGDRIANAYINGDTSGLNEDELLALDAAIALVETAKQSASDTLSLEVALHELLRERITPEKKYINMEDPSAPPRFMTVVGALLDGVANTHGYADAFYTVAKIAGFEVGRMCAVDESWDVIMLNTIKLDGAWYVVDAYYNDLHEMGWQYGVFNEGRGSCWAYNWGDEMQHHDIAAFAYDSTFDYDAEIPQITDLYELRDYINDELENDHTDFVFEYTGMASDITKSTIDNMCIGNTTSMFNDPDNKKIYYISVLERPGYRIVDAYFSGDTSLLSPDEVEALEIAKQIVEDAKAVATTEFELETLLHDALVTRMVYDNAEGEDDAYGTQRIYSAVGGLLDGAGNCQSYTDAFYVVASIAGFTVSKMVVSVEMPSDHIVNTILLDGKWYVVDVTHDDPIGYEGEPIHRMLNFGRDLATYTWEDIYEPNPIADVSDENYYFYSPENEDISFTTVEDMARYLIEQLKSGVLHSEVILRGKTLSYEPLSNAINDLVVAENINCGWAIWTLQTGKDTVYIIEFALA